MANKLIDILKKSAAEIKKREAAAREYLGTLIKSISGKKEDPPEYKPGNFKDSYNRMGTLLQRNTANPAEYLARHQKNSSSGINRSHFGRLVMFRYDAKMKDELPYWDRFPLILPLEVNGNYLIGLNLHYLHPKLRAVLLDAIVDNELKNKFYEGRRMTFNYNLMKKASKSNLYKPCVKKYILSSKHVTSKFITIPPEEYSFALFLPYEMFQKKSKQHVWAESLKIARGRKSN